MYKVMADLEKTASVEPGNSKTSLEDTHAYEDISEDEHDYITMESDVGPPAARSEYVPYETLGEHKRYTSTS